MGVEAFLVVPKNEARVFLRRYDGESTWDPVAQRSSYARPCPLVHGYHEASVDLDVRPHTKDNPDGTCNFELDSAEFPHEDPRWPKACPCGYEFRAEDEWQAGHRDLYVRIDGQPGVYTLRDQVPGMMWDAPWMGEYARGVDGRCLVVVLPNGHEWMIDGPASNCTMKGEKTHRCWIRHGTPPKLTVDKNAGTSDASAPTTCAAGAGSIQGGDYHGFLQGGVFT